MSKLRFWGMNGMVKSKQTGQWSQEWDGSSCRWLDGGHLRQIREQGWTALGWLVTGLEAFTGQESRKRMSVVLAEWWMRKSRKSSQSCFLPTTWAMAHLPCWKATWFPWIKSAWGRETMNGGMSGTGWASHSCFFRTGLTSAFLSQVSWQVPGAAS